MSWKATGWAKATRGHRSHGCKTVLMVLACYHNDDEGVAWPSQAMLSEDCEMPKRTVQWCLAILEKQGFITTLQKGNQYQPTKYRLNFEVVKAQDGASEPAISDKCRRNIKQVKAQGATSEGATPRHTNHKEPSLEPSLNSVSSEPEGSPETDGKAEKSAHQKVMDWYQEALGYRIPNGGKEGKAVKWMLGFGYTLEDIRGCYEHLKAQHFWEDKHLSLTKVKEEIGAWSQWKKTGQPARASPGSRVRNGTAPSGGSDGISRRHLEEDFEQSKRRAEAWAERQRNGGAGTP